MNSWNNFVTTSGKAQVHNTAILLHTIRHAHNIIMHASFKLYYLDHNAIQLSMILKMFCSVELSDYNVIGEACILK